MIETWKPVNGYEGIYEVSDCGNIKRVGAWSDGRKTKPVGIIKLNHKKYLRINLFRDGKKRERPVHRVVYESFVGPIPDGYEINHKNGNKYDNRVENLEAVTHSQNQVHMYWVLNKAHRPGSKHHNAKLTEEEVISIREQKKNGTTIRSLSEKYGVSRGTIEDMIYRVTWRHI